MTSPAEEGNPTSRICSLGEAPAKVEMASGRPLVGPSGHLFNWCLHRAGIARGECYLLNVWPFEIRKREHTNGSVTFYRQDGQELWNKKTGFTEEGLADAGPTIQRLRESSWNVVCPLGEAALNLVASEWQITKWRGSILASDRFPGRKVVGTRHPAASLRGDYGLRYTIINDLKRVREEALTSEIRLPQRELLIKPTLAEALTELSWFGPLGDEVATDIEVMNHQVDCFSISWTPERAMTIPLIGVDGKNYWTEQEELHIWTAYASLMHDPQIKKINQNILFDITHLMDKNHIHTRGPLGDCMVAHSLLNPWHPKSLAYLCSIYTREPYYKDENKFDSTPGWTRDMRFTYCAKDSAIALECWQVLEPELQAADMMETHDRTVAAFPCMAYMMLRGMKVNVEEKKRTRDRVNLEIDQLVSTFKARYAFNPSSNKDIHGHFYGDLGITPYLDRKTKKPTANDDALSRLWRTHGRQEAQEIQRIRELRKLCGTYLEMLLDPDNRLRSSYNPRGAWTGRLSSSKTIHGYGGNAQNLDPAFRSFIEAG